MADTFGQIGDALSGIGAGLTGQGLQFRQQLQNRREIEESQRQQQLQQQQEQQQQQQRDALERQKTVFTDSLSGLKLVNQGRFDLAAQLANNRFDALSQSFPGVDSSETQGIVQLSNIAAGGGEGAQEAQKLLKKTLENNVKIGRAQGILPEEEKGRILKSTEVVDGRIVRESPEGKITSEAVPGAVTKKTQDNLARELKTLDKRSAVATRTRDEINKQIRPFVERRQFSTTIDNILEGVGGVSDIALGVAFFKIVDPGSTVTQNEFGQVAKSRALDAQVVGIFDKITRGDVLNDTERRKIARLAQSQLNKFRGQAKKDIKRLLNVANADKRFKSKFSQNEVFGGSVDDLLSGGEVDPSKLFETLPPVSGSAPQPSGFKVLGIE